MRLAALEAELPGLAAGTRRPANRSPRRTSTSVFRRAGGGRSSGRSTGSPSASPTSCCVSGDLLSRPRGEAELRRLLGRLERCYVGARQSRLRPLARPVRQGRRPCSSSSRRTLLLDEAREIALSGKRVQIVGVDPRTYDARRSPPRAPRRPRRRPAHLPLPLPRHRPSGCALGSFDLIFAGHLHDGQIALPYPGGKLRFAHLRQRQGRGLVRCPGGLLHISAGLGTTFVPFRFFARPEATELVLHTAS